MEPSTRVRRGPEVASRELREGAGALILHLETGAYFEVNAVGALVWKMLEEPRTLASIVEELRERLEEAPKGLHEEIGAYLEQLAERNLVVLEGGGTAS